MEAAQWNETVRQLKVAPTKELTSAIVEAMQGKTGAEQKEIAKQVAAEANGIVGPDSQTSNKLWRIVISAFSIVLVGGFIALALGMFLPWKGQVTPELILTTFTSVVGFLAGLFTPSPVSGTANGKTQ